MIRPFDEEEWAQISNFLDSAMFLTVRLVAAWYSKLCVHLSPTFHKDIIVHQVML